MDRNERLAAVSDIFKTVCSQKVIPISEATKVLRRGLSFVLGDISVIVGNQIFTKDGQLIGEIHFKGSKARIIMTNNTLEIDFIQNKITLWKYKRRLI